MVITDAEQWVLREVLSLIPEGPFGACESLAAYVIHKCEKNGVPKERCEVLLETFDLHHVDEEGCDNREGCEICVRMAEYSPAR
jgi:hypothetical protein